MSRWMAQQWAPTLDHYCQPVHGESEEAARQYSNPLWGYWTLSTLSLIESVFSVEHITNSVKWAHDIGKWHLCIKCVILVLPLISAVNWVIEACCLWNCQAGRSHQCETISPSRQILSLEWARSITRRFPAEEWLQGLAGWQTWCSIEGQSQWNTLNKMLRGKRQQPHQRDYTFVPAIPSWQQRLCPSFRHLQSRHAVHTQMNWRDYCSGFPAVLCSWGRRL